jgi:outer membrane protein assembly factor BamA
MRRPCHRRLLLAALLALAAAPAAAQTGKLVAIKVTGSAHFPEEQIVAVTGLRLGASVTRDDLQAAADHLAQIGYFHNVRYKFSSRGEDIELEFQVEDAPVVLAWFDNFPWFTDEELEQALRKAVKLYNGTAPEAGTVIEAMRDALAALVAKHGIRAQVECMLIARPGEDGLMQQFRLLGPTLKVGALDFTDALARDDRRVRERLSDVVGKPYSRFALRLFMLEQVRPAYLARGHLRVVFGDPAARFTGDPNKPLPDEVSVTQPVAPGPLYHWGGAAWSGNTVFGAAALDSYAGMLPGEVANGLKIEAAWERVRAQYGRLGHVEVKFEPEPVFDDAAGKVSFRVRVTEGPEYRMGDLVVTGLSPAAERTLRAAWQLARGVLFDKTYFDTFLAKEVKVLFVGTPVHFNEVGHWLQTNPQTKTVDVLLDFR